MKGFLAILCLAILAFVAFIVLNALIGIALYIGAGILVLVGIPWVILKLISVFANDTSNSVKEEQETKTSTTPTSLDNHTPDTTDTSQGVTAQYIF